MQYTPQQDKLDRYLNSFATQSFRDQADRDYIAARLACRAELFPQFLWASQQAIEKYLKAILLYNRIKAKRVGHNIDAAMQLTSQLSFTIHLSQRSKKFIKHIAECGEFRYIDVPYHVTGYVLVDLDLTVWELRRYCQVLNVFGKTLPAIEEEMLQKAKADIALSETTGYPRHKFRLKGGWLETVLNNPKHPSRTALLWQNPVYGVRKRKTVRVKNHLHAQNSMLYLFPDMIDEALKFIFLPDKLANAYREHLATIQADPSKRP